MRTPKEKRRAAGFTLLEGIVAAFLGGAVVLGLLAVLDSAGRLNKSEIAAAEAQGSLRYATNRIAGVVRMAGTGGLFVTQSVLVRPDPALGGIDAGTGGDFDNVIAGTVTNLSGGSVPVRPGTDMLDVRGVIFSALVGFDDSSGCGSCTGVVDLPVPAVTARNHINDDPSRRPQFSEIDRYTEAVSPEKPMFVVAASADDLHPGCPLQAAGRTLPPQATYAVGKLSAPTALAARGTFGWIDFGDAVAREFGMEDPNDPAPTGPAASLGALNRAGILDDVLFFIDDSDPLHPVLAQGLRRGARFDVFPLADDVEDLQVAYGVDGLYGLDGVDPDGSLGRLLPTSSADPDPDVSSQPDGDEWAPNVSGERSFRSSDFQSVQPAPAGFPHDGTAATAHCPLLRGVLISLVVRSHSPDPSYRGPESLGIRTMNSTEARGGSTPGVVRYRRRSQTMKLSLRNWELDG